MPGAFGRLIVNDDGLLSAGRQLPVSLRRLVLILKTTRPETNCARTAVVRGLKVRMPWGFGGRRVVVCACAELS